ncbi:oxidoreductase [Rhodococcus sp. 15-725-2-2b]|uniref:SDR family oxidoreductase n=1 Tax=unclassified Rhodococcus (in: high G+C Gram-positive bacteria) TaxID=192944 RepID=UPI000B9BB1A7|nr:MULTISPECIES: SDR family oxidoreductase [unclassified Rhodococcus (in: high G+C Gram-positive bacteria)]OZC63625.1 oxidoreductase [Rhodococcus sp. 06-469-3-2]OZD40790.1 oxidoreductase [Rhodococcus sp. 06-1477-1A]OZE67102.1 oxidoreductase [Rhodococcus sp. 15-725-2-2b]
MKMSGNTILITGGTSGIGYGLARRLHAAGNTVIVAGRRKHLLDKITAEHPRIESVVLDVADPISIAQAADVLSSGHPELNVVINNAGIMLKEDLRDPASLQIAEDHVTTNLLGTIRMTYTFLPHLVSKDAAAIINVTSSLAFVPLPTTPTYNATKAALHSFTTSLRVQLADTAVQVIELVPPGVRTTLLGQEDDENAMPLEDFLSETMALLVAQPKSREIVVERAKYYRDAEAEGRYEDVLMVLSGF